MTETNKKPTAHVIALGMAQVRPMPMGKMKTYQNVIALRFESKADFIKAVREGVLVFKDQETDS